MATGLAAETWKLEENVLKIDYRIEGSVSSFANDSSLLEYNVVSLVAEVQMLKRTQRFHQQVPHYYPSEGWKLLA